MNSLLRRNAMRVNQAEHAPATFSHCLMTAIFAKGSTTVMYRCSAFVVSASLLIAVSGCEQGIQRVAISGKVLLDGEPLPKGTIRFVPTSGRPASSNISSDGSFRVVTKMLSEGGTEVEGLYPGSYRIAVLSTEDLGDAEDAEVQWLVPRHYGDFRSSGLEVEIQNANDSLVLELIWGDSEKENSETDTRGPSPPREDPKTSEEQKDDV